MRHEDPGHQTFDPRGDDAPPAREVLTPRQALIRFLAGLGIVLTIGTMAAWVASVTPVGP